jgi:para-nitrobenzyl esterase
MLNVPRQFLAVALLAVAAPLSAAPVVETPAGSLEGLAQGATEAFLGVPYAAAPVGDLRWRAPQAARPWRGVRHATAFGASCMQQWPMGTFGPYTAEFVDTPAVAEDCLFLNIWKPAQADRPLPVFVWVHGGAFLGGSGAVPIYDGKALAARGAVVVTINYRVGVFGFLAHPGLTAENPEHTSGNYGLLDQVAALQWVRDNIAAFGGDPQRVTVSGQSAGAASVEALLLMPAARGLFQRAIVQSGPGLGIGSPSLATAERKGSEFAASAGATGIARLRALPAAEVQAQMEKLLALPSHEGGGPTVRFLPVTDGKLLPADPDAPGSAMASDVPLMVGYTADEALAPSATTAADFEKHVRRRYGASAGRLLALYPHATDAEALESARLLARDQYMATLVLWVEGRAGAGRPPIYAYRFEHPVPVAKPPSQGAFHTAEVPYLFGAMDVTLRPYTDVDRRVSAIVQDYWLNFMRAGDPNGSGVPSWSATAAGAGELMLLGPAPLRANAVSTPQRLQALREHAASGGTLGLR